MKTSRLLYWTPRVLSILFICFLTMFSLDVFEPGRSAGEIAIGLLMHNIPSIILTILLVISWKKEIVGALGYFGAGLFYAGLVIKQVSNSDLPWYDAITRSLVIAGPAIIIGILFLINWRKRKENMVRKLDINKLK